VFLNSVVHYLCVVGGGQVQSQVVRVFKLFGYFFSFFCGEVDLCVIGDQGGY